MARGIRHGVRKVCTCGPSKWAKCSHAWHFSYKWAGVHHRYSLDRLLPKPVRLKSDAEKEANTFRAQIQAGTFKAPGSDSAAAVPVSPAVGLTLAQLLENHRLEYVMVQRPGTADRHVSQLAVIERTVLALPTGEPRAFGEWLVSDIKPATLEKFRAARLAAPVAANRNLALLRGAFAWAVRQELIERTPFKVSSETVVKLQPEQKRSRRLEPGEGERLLAGCGASLRPIVEAALETGCRRGEILSLQWAQVRLDARGEIFLPGQKTKTKKDRRIPISSRLRAILEMRRHDAEGKEHAPDAYVFGNAATGLQVRSFKRAWEMAVLRAHGVKPKRIFRVKGGRKVWTATLTPECRAELHRIDLHFHDLRHEAGSRWQDGGVTLTLIRDWLGHSNIAQTSTYLQSQTVGQNDAMRQYEERRAALQRIATDADRNVRKQASAAIMRAKRTSKSLGKHQVQ